MNAPDDPNTLSPEARLAALTPEEKQRIGIAMRYLVDIKTLHVEGLNLGNDLLQGNVPATDIAKGLMDLQHALRAASEEIVRRPLTVAHAMALRSGETKLDYEPWLRKVRVEAAQDRTDKAEHARQDRFKPISKPSVPVEDEEPETVSAPRP